MGNPAPTVVVIDDSAEVRALVKTKIRLSGLLTVVGEGRDGTEAIGLAYRHRPDVLLLDMSMPTMDGLDALPGILTVSPETRIVVYTGFEADGLAARARELGAVALLEKSLPIDRLPGELHAVASSDARSLADVIPAQPVLRAVGAAEQDDQNVLDEHLERFHEVFDQAAIGMATMTLTGGIVRANRALGKVMLHKHRDLVGLDYATLTSGRADLFAAALDQIEDEAVDLVHIEHDVSGASPERTVLTTLAPVRDARGQPLYIFLQVQDVTAQRAAEDDLRQSEERFRLLVEAVEDYAIFMLSPEGIIVSWNAGAQRTKGYQAHEIIGRHFRTFYSLEQQEAHHPEYELERAIVDGHYSEEGWRIRNDGSRFWANVVITALFDDAGQHIGFAKVTRDVTGAREATETLRQSEERFRLLVEAVGDYAIFMLDPTGHVVSWNAGAQRSKGYAAREIIGQHFRVFYLPEQQSVGHPERELEIALAGGRYEEEGWRIRKDGTRFWANVVITAIFNDVGEHVGFAKVTRDTTERRDAEQEREQAATELATANVSLEEMNMRLLQAAADQSQFLAVTAHELRTPAAVLGGSADTLARHWAELTDDERTGLLDGMTTSATRLRRLLSDLLTASRLDADSLRLHPVPTPVELLISSVRASHAQIEIDVAPLPGVTVLADADRLAQAMDNLIDNALSHGAPPVRVGVQVEGPMAHIRVTDSGDGVDPAMLPRLFERFATGDQIGGTGLGLFIVRELATANGGNAFYEPGSDTQPAGAFVLSVPLA